MARVPYRSKNQLSEEHKHLLERSNNFLKALANHPAAMEVFMSVNRWIRHSSELDPRLRELALLQVGYSTASGYEFSHHLKLAPDFGVSPEDIEAICSGATGEPSSLNEVDRSVAAIARSLTTELTVNDHDWAIVQDAIGPTHAIELVLAVSYYNHVVRVMLALDIDVEPEYAVLLEGFTPPEEFGRWR